MKNGEADKSPQLKRREKVLFQDDMNECFICTNWHFGLYQTQRIITHQLQYLFIFIVPKMQFKNVKQRARLDKISEASSPDGSKQQVPSPLKNGRGRINFGGMGSSYLSFFRIEKEQEIKDSKLLNEEKGQLSTKEMIEEKNKQIEELQKKVTAETIKKNAREKSFSQRVTADWSQSLEMFLRRLSLLCIKMSKSSPEHKMSVLKVLHKSCNGSSGEKERALGILGWILRWIQPIMRMLHEIIKSKFK